MPTNENILVRPIGRICSHIVAQQTGGFEDVESTIELLPEYSEFVIGFEDYSHVTVVYWLSEQTEVHGLHRPQSNPNVPEVGMFACR